MKTGDLNLEALRFLLFGFNFLGSCIPDSFFPIEIIRLLTFDDDAIRRR